MAVGVATVWVAVEDMDRALAFYRDVLGLPVHNQGDDWSELDANGLRIGLNARENATTGGGGAVITFQPDSSIDEEVDRLKGQGVEFTGEISEHPWGRIAPFRDSEGNDLQFYAPPR
ncbi:VOC family protein [uncultured Jatrophihabitans sp.]|uniref:VOC family protein n=1 Tax=uncultured Jatrophihabitans sp. TaxID=1610747 RepID=UPI0035CB1711